MVLVLCLLALLFPSPFSSMVSEEGADFLSLPYDLRGVSGCNPSPQQLEFNGTRAFIHLEAQCSFGPRPPGSDNLTRCGDYIVSVLREAGWPVHNQTWTFQGVQLRNIVAGAIQAPVLVVLAHYDTRPRADREPDPADQAKPILGANDGASGVAVLLELATVLPPEASSRGVLLFVDAEDSGGIAGWPWIVGSTHYVESLTLQQREGIQAAVLLDMVGDADLQIKREGSSTPQLTQLIWQTAHSLGYAHLFLDVAGYTLIDDHRPFLDAGIPACDIIDFDYPYWHTLADTPDKCSPGSLEAVGRVVESFLLQQLDSPCSFRTSLPLTVLMVFVAVGVAAAAGVAGGLKLARRRRRREGTGREGKPNLSVEA